MRQPSWHSCNVHPAFRPSAFGADAARVKRSSHPSTRSARTIRRVGVVCAVLALATVAALAPSGAAAAGDDGGDISGGLTELGRSDNAGYDPYAQPSTPGADDASSAATTDAQAEDEPVTGTTKELELQRAQLVSTRNAQQSALLAQEATRRAAESRRDNALEAIAARIVALYRAGDDARVQAVIVVRDEEDPATREAELLDLTAADRALFTEYDAASEAVAKAAAAAESTRASVLDLGTQIAAVDAVLDGRVQPTQAETARAQGKRFSIDADYVFATGPIPSIGYWGAMDGGGMLTGWMGYAGAAVGGIGCEPPQANLQPTGQVESGEASWYGPGFQGKGTANGETFDTNQLTAAHKTLPFGSIVRVYSSSTARCVFVRINDRGPYVDGRVIDLSRAAADAIGMESVADVQLEVYSPAG